MAKNSSPSSFVTQLDADTKEKLLQDLKDQGFEISKPQYTYFQAKKPSLTCTLYDSGKLVVQGKASKEFIEFYLEPEILGTFNYKYAKEFIDKTPRIGVDEAGKGDFFGPLCIAGVYAGEKEIDTLLSIGVKDSKTMQDSTILKMGPKIRQAVPYHIIRISPQKYNALYLQFKNLNLFLAWAHASVIEKLIQETGCKSALVDQFSALPLVENALKRKKIEINFTKKTKAESDPVVAAASILARESFLLGMKWLSEKLHMEIPKGASNAVIEAAKKLYIEHGESIFEQVAKKHFKTLDKILNQL